MLEVGNWQKFYLMISYIFLLKWERKVGEGRMEIGGAWMRFEVATQNAFKIWCWKRLLRVPWTARRSNQSILKEISPGCSLEGLMLRLKLQYFGHLMWITDSLEGTLMLGKTEAGGEGENRGWDGWMASPSKWTWVWVGSGSWWWTGRPGVLQSMGSQRVGHDWIELIMGYGKGRWMGFSV